MDWRVDEQHALTLTNFVLSEALTRDQCGSRHGLSSRNKGTGWTSKILCQKIIERKFANKDLQVARASKIVPAPVQRRREVGHSAGYGPAMSRQFPGKYHPVAAISAAAFSRLEKKPRSFFTLGAGEHCQKAAEGSMHLYWQFYRQSEAMLEPAAE